MTVTTLDTLKIAQRLKEAGQSEQVAETTAEIMRPPANEAGSPAGA